MPTVEWPLGRVVKDDSDGMTPARAHSADTMAKIHAIAALGALDGPVVHGEGDRIALPERHHLGAGLHSGPLLGEHELAAGEIDAWFRQKDRDLDRKGELAVEILMQAVEVAGNILQQERRRPCLAGSVASLEEGRVIIGISLAESHPLVPRIGHAGEASIEGAAQTVDQARKRIFEVA